MSISTLLLTLSPLLLLIAVFGTVVIVALYRAKPEDVPAVLRESVHVFRRLADRLPDRHTAVTRQHDDGANREEEVQQ